MTGDMGTATIGQLLALWSAWAIGPIAWGVHLMASYLLVKPACEADHAWVLHGTTLATALVALAGVAVSWRWGRGAVFAKSARDVRLLAIGGMLINAYSVLIIVVEGLPSFIVSPCL